MPQQAVAATGAVPKGAARVLVVDNDEETRVGVMGALEAEGFQGVEMAASAAEAMKKLRAGHFHVVLTDLRMPGHNGPWLAGHVEHLRQMRRPKVVVLTGEMGEVRVNGHEVLGVLRKPFQSDEFVILLERAGIITPAA